MLRIKDISKTWHGQSVLNGVSFVLNPNEKIALVGANGVGKSTLLKIIAGLVNADSGEIENISGMDIAYLPQELKLDEALTISEYVKISIGLADLEKNMEHLAGDLSSQKSKALYAESQDLYERKKGYSFQNRLQLMLQGFGMADLQPDRLISSLSGGQKNKVALLAVLLQEVDILLLDEPTNNLDLPAIIWLETFLSKTKVSLIIISHDRFFLDKIADKVVEIDWFKRQAIEFPGTYSRYLVDKQAKLAKQKQAARLQREEIKRVLGACRKQKQWALEGAKQTTKDNDKYIRGAQRDRSAGLASKAKAAEKKLARLERIEIYKERIPLSIPLSDEFDKSRPAIILSGIQAGYDGRVIIGPLDLQVEYGSRVGILGLNGQGKTVLLKLITRDLQPITGEVKISPSLKPGNLMQQHENLDFGATVIDFILRKVNLPKEDIYNLLNIFNFNFSAADKKIGDLSPGERARLLFLLFAANSVNALILDEPSNHLDLEALAALEEVLQTYRGTVVFVSHDRYFLDKVHPTKLYQLSRGRLSLITDFDKYLSGLQSQAQELFKKIKTN